MKVGACGMKTGKEAGERQRSGGVTTTSWKRDRGHIHAQSHEKDSGSVCNTKITGEWAEIVYEDDGYFFFLCQNWDSGRKSSFEISTGVWN